MKFSVEIPKGKSLYQVLREKGLMTSAYCGGRGICGKCRVKVDGKEELACLIFGPFKGTVEVEESQAVFEGSKLNDIETDTGLKGYGVALDLGTTSLEGALFKLETGKYIKSLKTLNLQASFGADVISRIENAGENYGRERELLLESLEKLLLSFKERIDFVVVVSNPVMHHFLLGLSVKGFERFPFKLELEDGVYLKGREISLNSFKETVFYIPPLLKNFVGSDFLSNFLFLEERLSDFLVADLGTNAEIGLYTKERKMATSVPAGPAFEGVGLFSAMAATEGAIYKVFFDGRDFRFLTIGNTKPKGMCASAYFDLIYLLKSFRALNREGTFSERAPLPISRRIKEINGEKGFILYEDREVIIALTQKDIRKFLLAKGAVYGALKCLNGKGTEKLIFSGAFGSHVDPRSVKGIKLIPEDLPPPEAGGNLALKGAALMLGRKEKRKRIEELKGEVEVIELATHKEFEKAYLEGLEL